MLQIYQSVGFSLLREVGCGIARTDNAEGQDEEEGKDVRGRIVGPLDSRSALWFGSIFISPCQLCS